MRIIGITGGVGAGKTQILSYIETHYRCRVIRADEAAHMLEEPGQECYVRLVELLGQDILNKDGTINKRRMADIVFANKDTLTQVNAIVHPEVKKYILEQIRYERERGVVEFFFIEAALLIEERYDLIADELWYIHADAAVREKRLVQERHYSTEKAAAIMKGQLSEAEFRKHCGVVIQNNGDLTETYRQVREVLGSGN